MLGAAPRFTWRRDHENSPSGSLEVGFSALLLSVRPTRRSLASESSVDRRSSFLLGRRFTGAVPVRDHHRERRHIQGRQEHRVRGACDGRWRDQSTGRLAWTETFRKKIMDAIGKSCTHANLTLHTASNTHLLHFPSWNALPRPLFCSHWCCCASRLSRLRALWQHKETRSAACMPRRFQCNVDINGKYSAATSSTVLIFSWSGSRWQARPQRASSATSSRHGAPRKRPEQQYEIGRGAGQRGAQVDEHIEQLNSSAYEG